MDKKCRAVKSERYLHILDLGITTVFLASN
jgi:hypothetical protein